MLAQGEFTRFAGHGLCIALALRRHRLMADVLGGGHLCVRSCPEETWQVLMTNQIEYWLLTASGF